MKQIHVVESVLKASAAAAGENRRLMDEAGLLAVNYVTSIRGRGGSTLAGRWGTMSSRLRKTALSSSRSVNNVGQMPGFSLGVRSSFRFERVPLRSWSAPRSTTRWRMP